MTLTVAQVAERYGVSIHTVLHWIATGQLHALNVGLAPGKKKPRWRLRESDLISFELTRSATTSAPTIRRRRKRDDQVIEFIK